MNYLRTQRFKTKINNKNRFNQIKKEKILINYKKKSSSLKINNLKKNKISKKH